MQKKKVRIYDCKSDKVVYNVDRWEYIICDCDLFDSFKNRTISYFGAECENGIAYLDIYLSELDSEELSNKV